MSDQSQIMLAAVLKTNMQGSIAQINGEMYRYTRRMIPASQNSLPLFEGSLRRRRWMKWN
jgi:hypothetical protein